MSQARSLLVYFISHYSPMLLNSSFRCHIYVFRMGRLLRKYVRQSTSLSGYMFNELNVINTDEIGKSRDFIYIINVQVDVIQNRFH